jgi:hypothetical protein
MEHQADSLAVSVVKALIETRLSDADKKQLIRELQLYTYGLQAQFVPMDCDHTRFFAAKDDNEFATKLFEHFDELLENWYDCGVDGFIHDIEDDQLLVFKVVPNKEWNISESIDIGKDIVEKFKSLMSQN